METIELNGVKYVKESDIPKTTVMAKKKSNMPYVMCRTYSAGVFAGYLESRKGQEVVLRDARRIYYRDGAASLSQLATEGTSKPNTCKFPCSVDTVELLQAIEIIPITEKARESIQAVKERKE